MAALTLDRRVSKLRNALKRHPGSQSLRDRLRTLQHQRAPQPAAKAPGKPGRPRTAAPKRQGSPIPYSTASDTSLADARTAYEQEMANLAGQGIQVEQAYGIAAPYNDPATNPYSAAALLQANYDRTQLGSTTSYAAGGQLYAGSLQNARNFNRANYGLAYDKMLGKYLSLMAEIANKKTTAGVDLQRARQDAYAQALEDALNTTPDPTEYPAPVTKPKPGGGGPGQNGTPSFGGGGRGGTGFGGGKRKHKKKKKRRNQGGAGPGGRSATGGRAGPPKGGGWEHGVDGGRRGGKHKGGHKDRHKKKARQHKRQQRRQRRRQRR